MKHFRIFVFIAILFCAYTTSVAQQYETLFQTRAEHIISSALAIDDAGTGAGSSGDFGKHNYPYIISIFETHGLTGHTLCDRANEKLTAYKDYPTFHFNLVGLPRILYKYPTATGIVGNEQEFLTRVFERTDSYNAWTAEGTENHLNMSRTSGYLYAQYAIEKFPTVFTEAPAKLDSMKKWILYYSNRIYQTGTGEFNSSNYGVYNIIGWLNLYDFAKDPQVKRAAKAVLDYNASELALHYSQGIIGGAEGRGTPATKSVDAETASLLWLWYGDAPKQPTIDAKKATQAVHAATSSYRPPELAVKLARKEFTTPAVYKNSKGSYLMKTPSYIKQIFYISNNFTLGSAFFPYGGYASSTWKNVTWKLVSRVDSGQGKEPQMITGGGLYYSDKNGRMRNPYAQYTQHENVLILMNKTPTDAETIITNIQSIFTTWATNWETDFIERFSAGDDKITAVGNPVKFQDGARNDINNSNGSYIYLPNVESETTNADIYFIELEKSYVAVQSLNQKSPVLTTNYAQDNAPNGQLCGLVLEIVEASDYASFADFQTAVINKAGLDVSQLANDKVTYTTLNDDVIVTNYQEEGAFTEPIYDWGYGPQEASLIHTSPPFIQPTWPIGKGHGRLASWTVNGTAVDLSADWGVFDGDNFYVKNDILKLFDGDKFYQVDFVDTLPIFSVSSDDISLAANTFEGDTAELGEIKLAVTETVSSGSIDSVLFYIDGLKVGTSTSTPYEVNWTQNEAGKHRLVAVAYANEEPIASEPYMFNVREKTTPEPVNINQVEAEVIYIYPNPANDNLNIKLETPVNGYIDIEITNQTGQIVLKQKFKKTSNQITKNINISKLQNGLYFISVKNGNIQSTTKFMKK